MFYTKCGICQSISGSKISLKMPGKRAKNIKCITKTHEQNLDANETGTTTIHQKAAMRAKIRTDYTVKD